MLYSATADSNPTLMVHTAHALGVQVIRFNLLWANVAPDRDSRREPRFDATNSCAYPAANWGTVDLLDRLASENGIKVYLTLTSPAPLWASGKHSPTAYDCAACAHWEPSARDYEAWVEAVGRRYDGRYTPKGDTSPLPRVSFWSIWNEPNDGQDLAPQATGTKIIVDRAAPQYRRLLDAGWNGLAAIGHTAATDTILIGETAPRGVLNPMRGDLTNPRIASDDQYLLEDPNPKQPHGSKFFTGIETSTGVPKGVLFAAYRLPLFLPETTAAAGTALSVWGCDRPALRAGAASARVDIQFASHGGDHFHTVKAVTLHPATASGCYFDTTVRFPGSGDVRLAYGSGADTLHSRAQAITIR